MPIITAVDICNLALSNIGAEGSVTTLSPPSTDTEKVFSNWYDVARRAFIREAMPNFAMWREYFAKEVSTPAFGYSYQYAVPTYCVRVLGIGEIGQKDSLAYSYEGGKILSNEDYTDGMPVRILKDITDVSKWPDDLKIAFGWKLATMVSAQLTQDSNKVEYVRKGYESALMGCSGINAQENKPIRKDTSRFKQARWGVPADEDKS